MLGKRLEKQQQLTHMYTHTHTASTHTHAMRNQNRNRNKRKPSSKQLWLDFALLSALCCAYLTVAVVMLAVVVAFAFNATVLTGCSLVCSFAVIYRVEGAGEESTK